MGVKKILVVDDEQMQAKALAGVIEKNIVGADVFYASDEEEIKDRIRNSFYNLLVLDIRMDHYETNGIALAKEAISNNPFTKIIFVSRFLSEYLADISPLMRDGRILAFSEKEPYDEWIKKLKPIIDDYYASADEQSQAADALVSYYAEAKNETDAYKKGERFEHFVAMLFANIGYKEILSRVKDAALNEVDLIVRNDIEDLFLSKLGKYFFVECKNKPEHRTDKNDIIVFGDKLSRSNGMAEFGFIFTTSTITRNSIVQLVKMDTEEYKIIIVDNVAIMDLIQAQDMKECLKKLIDQQVHRY